MTNPYQTRGLEAAGGQRFIEVRAQDQVAVVPLRAFSLANKQLETMLEHLHVAIFDKESKQALIAEVKAVSAFSPADVIEAPGWAGTYFAVGDGTVIEPTDREPIVTFVPDRSRIIQTGTLEDWKTHVAMPLNGQRIPMLVVMAALVPPLMRFMPHAENIVIELIGEHGTGKSTVVGIASSTIGGNGIKSTMPYATCLTTLMQDPAAKARMHRDHPMMIEAVDVYAGQALAKELQQAFNFFGNGLPNLWRMGPSSEVRTVALLSGRSSLRTLAGFGPDEGADGLITLNVPFDRHRVFDSLPAGYESASDFADAIAMASAHYHGSAFRHLVDTLAKLPADQRNFVSQHLAEWQKRFLDRVAAKDKLLAGSRAARSFATIYAVGKYAQSLEILPREWNCWSATSKCLTSERNVVPTVAPFENRLEDLVASGACLSVSIRGNFAAQAFVVRPLGVTLWTFSDHREVRIRKEKITELFPDWEAIKKSEGVKNLLIRPTGDGNRLMQKKPLVPGERPTKRLYCFRLPLHINSQEDPSLVPEDLDLEQDFDRITDVDFNAEVEEEDSDDILIII